MLLSKISDFFKSLLPNMQEVGKVILRGVITIILGYIIMRIIKMIINKILKKTHMDNIVISFIMSVVTVILYLTYIFIVASSFNIPTTSLAAIIASSGVAIGLALKDSLSNIANGLVILITKPFKEGDFVSIAGSDGTVKSINIVNTILTTPDNKQITVPNNTVTASNIINYSKNDIRRLDLTFNIPYGYDINMIKEVLSETVTKHEQVLEKPNPTIRVGDITNDYMIFFCRVWVSSKEFWPTKFDLLEIIMNTFKEKSIEIAHSQLDVNIKE